MRYNIRPMVVEDIEEVVKGEEKIFGTSLGFDMLYTDLTLNPYATYLVLEINGNVHGYIGLWIDENAEIINFYVDKEYQQQGFGLMMLNFALQLCEMSKIKHLTLEVRPSNLKAFNLYKKKGFTVSHRRSAYYSDGEDALVMIKEFQGD